MKVGQGSEGNTSGAGRGKGKKDQREGSRVGFIAEALVFNAAIERTA